MELTEILKCPKTGNKLRFDEANSVVVVEDSPITYPINDGIVDFCPEAKDKVSKSYDGFASGYDAYFTSSSLSMKLFNLLFFGGWNYSEYSETVLSYFPSQFDGVLLDVPVGTGLVTASQYAQYPNATIIAVDYSIGMLEVARKRFEEQGLNNVVLVRADVANLPLTDGAVDIVVSMAGLHAFPDKQAAVAEMGRVLHPDGSLVASSYVRGDKWLFDWGVKHFAVRKGFFSLPFFTKDDIGSYLEGFNIKRQVNMKSGVYFEAGKVV
jgi:ubiquinone/menaquinone biosynthesis C-methylase UbiE